jgi:hypothetical protein
LKYNVVLKKYNVTDNQGPPGFVTTFGGFRP